MFLINFRTSQPILLNTRFSEFILKFNGANTLTESLQRFLQILEKNYLSLTNLESNSSGQTLLSQSIQNAANYLYQLDLLISKMNLKDLNSFDFGFNWKETTTQKTITTNNIWFEYYSVVYNIGIMLYLIAENLVIQGNYTTLTLEQAKEAREKYSQALFYFEKIKNEIGVKLTEEEKGEDFSPKGIDYMKNLCLMGGFIALMNASYSKFKQYMKEVNANTSINNPSLKGTFESNFNQRLSITDQITIYADYIVNYLKTRADDNQLLIDYFEYQRDYFKALIEFFKYEYYHTINEIEGGKLGYAITYLSTYIEMKKNLVSKYPNLNKLVHINKLSSDIENYEKELEVMKKTNHVLHNPTHPPPISIKINELKISPMNPNFTPNLEGISENDLLSIMSPELKNKIVLTTKELLAHFSNQLKFYSSEESIQTKLENIPLPLRVKIMVQQSNLDSENQQIWEKIEYIKKLNDVKCIFELLKTLTEKSKTLNENINEFIKAINLINTEDATRLKEFGMKWCIPRVNINYITFFQNKLLEINNFNSNKSKFESNFLNQLNIFDELKEPIEQIKLKNPKLTLTSCLPISDDESLIMEKIEIIQTLKEKLKETILKLENKIKNVNFLLPAYDLISNGKLTEIDLIIQQKEKVNNLVISELKPIETNINEKINELITISSKVVVSENEVSIQQKVNESKQIYISHYKEITDLYFKNLLKALNAYTTLISIINTTHQELNKAYQYLHEREVLQQKLLQSILRVNLNKEIKLKQPFPIENLNPKYKEILNEMALLGIDVAYLVTKFGGLSIK